jgi:hypothetical protein
MRRDQLAIDAHAVGSVGKRSTRAIGGERERALRHDSSPLLVDQ